MVNFFPASGLNWPALQFSPVILVTASHSRRKIPIGPVWDGSLAW